MKQPLVNSAKLARTLKGQINKHGMSYAEVARVTKVDASRISKICEGQFKRLSPVVRRVCDVLKTKPERYFTTELEPIPADLFADINRFINGKPSRARALQKVLRIVAKVAD